MSTSQLITQPIDMKVNLGDESMTVKVQPGETLLESALQAGLDAPYSCMAGVCTTCRAKLLSGDVIMENNDALTDEEIARGDILTCQAKPTSHKDLKIVYYDD